MFTRTLVTALACSLPAGLALAVPTPVFVPNHSFEERITPGSPIFEDPSTPLTAFGKGIDRYNKWNGEFWRHFEVDNNGGPLRIWNIGDPSNPAHIGTQGIADVGFGGNAPDGDLVVVVRSRYNDDELNVDDPGTPDIDESIRDFEAAVQILDNELFDSTKRYVLSAELGRLPNGAGEGGSVNYEPSWFGGSLMFAVGGTNVGGATFQGRVDGGTVIGQDDTFTLAPNTWTTSTVTIEPDPANAEFDGMPIQIRLAALEAEDHSLTQWAAWDNVSLTMEELSLLGDLNGDGSVTNGDINAFVLALTDPAGYASTYPDLDPDALGDFTGDGALTNGDIAGFVDALTGGASVIIPEPTSLALLGFGGLLITRRRRG